MARPADIIVKKRDGFELSREDILQFVKGYCEGRVPDYQMSSLLMAVFYRGMSAEETAVLTEAMINSGRVLDLSDIKKPLVDKHSTGGVGDKTSMMLAPIMAALGFADPMMSGRGLGHTGGTLDKLESISGYDIHPDEAKIKQLLRECGFAMFAQSDDMVVADKKMYALRDVTGTVESIPLMTASILSKKLAEGTKHLVMDVKYGSGAFMKNIDDAKKLADSLVRTAAPLGLNVKTLLSDMSQPLGRSVGNLLEMQEVAGILRDGFGQNPVSRNLEEVTINLAALMVQSILPDKTDAQAKSMVLDAVSTGAAYEKFLQNISMQGGDAKDLDRTPRCAKSFDIKAKSDGVITNIDAYKIGLSSMCLGAGRRTLDDVIDSECGIVIKHSVGDSVASGQTVVQLLYNRSDNIEEAITLAEQAVSVK